MGLKAIMVCVDYGDILSWTLPYNRHHFSEVAVVTTMEDELTHDVAEKNHASVYVTNSFYDGGASFNKWKALEEGLTALGREGWICVMDADVLWPKVVPGFTREIGNLYTPRRRMADPIPEVIPAEEYWSHYPLHPQQKEFAGYSQIFHASDPALGPSPWHETTWRHAGGADSFFQAKWAEENKIRPPFEVLHLGPAGVNWCGRASPYLNGDLPEKAVEKKKQLRRFIQGRGRGVERFKGEKLT